MPMKINYLNGGLMPNGIFRVKSLKNHLSRNQSQNLNFDVGCLWSSLLPKKMQVFHLDHYTQLLEYYGEMSGLDIPLYVSIPIGVFLCKQHSETME